MVMRALFLFLITVSYLPGASDPRPFFAEAVAPALISMLGRAGYPNCVAQPAEYFPDEDRVQKSWRCGTKSEVELRMSNRYLRKKLYDVSFSLQQLSTSTPQPSASVLKQIRTEMPREILAGLKFACGPLKDDDFDQSAKCRGNPILPEVTLLLPKLSWLEKKRKEGGTLFISVALTGPVPLD